MLNMNMNTQSNVAALKTKKTPNRNLIKQTLHKCNKCGRSFNTSDVFLKHMETLHGVAIDTIAKKKGTINYMTHIFI